MNYLKIYSQIIDRAKNNLREGYLEKHHIVPKCIGGDDTLSNLVLLTAREHYICHWLLAKHYKLKPLWAAFAMMNVSSIKHNRLNGSRYFERARIARSYAMSGEGNPRFGTPSSCIKHTEETKQKIRESKLGKKRAPFKRSSPNEETRNRISKANKGKAAWNKGIETVKEECPHCNKMVDRLNMKKWHGDKCKLSPLNRSIL